MTNTNASSPPRYRPIGRRYDSDTNTNTNTNTNNNNKKEKKERNAADKRAAQAAADLRYAAKTVLEAFKDGEQINVDANVDANANAFVYDKETKSFSKNLVTGYAIPVRRRFDVRTGPRQIPYDVRSLREQLNRGIDKIPHAPGSKLSNKSIEKIDWMMPSKIVRDPDAIEPAADAALTEWYSRYFADAERPVVWATKKTPDGDGTFFPFSFSSHPNRRKEIEIALFVEDQYYFDEEYETYFRDPDRAISVPMWNLIAAELAAIRAATELDLAVWPEQTETLAMGDETNRDVRILRRMIARINDAPLENLTLPWYARFRAGP